MANTTNMAETLFARALELSAGPPRNNFLAKECAHDSLLRREVESLLAAHSAAGGFLQGRAGTTATARCSGGTLHAAAQAGAFLRRADPAAGGQVEEFIASLPEEIRREARERIEAGLCARRLHFQPQDAGAALEDPAPCLPGFRIERKLGEGALGVVYAAHDEKLNRRVAVKVLRSRAGEQVRRRVLDEARNAAALSNPAVVTIFSVLDESNPPAIVMELVEGFSLDRFAAQLNFEQKARLLREVAGGLAAAHEHGLVHRDLKPDNIIVGPDMRPRILDFGLALSLEEASRLEGGFAGTPLYASPEQVRGHPLAAASDVFSLGAVMFKVLTGRAAFAGDTASGVLESIVTTAPPFLREVAVGVPEDLQAICLACLAWEQSDRPTAAEVAVELGRFLVGEPTRLKPKLYDDLLRRSISEYSSQARIWESQSIISREEQDSLEIMHRRLLADEDHWIIDARRITLLQTILSGGTWLAVVATVLTVWMLRDDLGRPWRWLLPAFFTLTLLAAGWMAQRSREKLASATFLAGAVLAIAPCTLALLAETGWFGVAPPGVTQLFGDSFTNQQVLISTFIALVVSGLGLWRLKMTGFAWTTAVLGVACYFSVQLVFNWLELKPEQQALCCLPLAAMEPIALVMERAGRVRWTLPFHLVSLVALVGALDVIAAKAPTLEWLGITSATSPYFDADRLQALSFVANGLLFLGLMLITDRSASLDLRRASRMLEILAILHMLSPLFINALDHRKSGYLRLDVGLYLGAAVLFMVLAPFRSRWRLLVGGLAGCGLGSYLLVNLHLVPRQPFIIGLGFTGLLVALGTFAYVRRRQQFRPAGAPAGSRGGSKSP
jgi:serine/threonine protein kinase